MPSPTQNQTPSDGCVAAAKALVDALDRHYPDESLVRERARELRYALAAKDYGATPRASEVASTTEGSRVAVWLDRNVVDFCAANCKALGPGYEDWTTHVGDSCRKALTAPPVVRDERAEVLAEIDAAANELGEFEVWAGGGGFSLRLHNHILTDELGEEIDPEGDTLLEAMKHATDTFAATRDEASSEANHDSGEPSSATPNPTSPKGTPS